MKENMGGTEQRKGKGENEIIVFQIKYKKKTIPSEQLLEMYMHLLIAICNVHENHRLSEMLCFPLYPSDTAQLCLQNVAFFKQLKVI